MYEDSQADTAANLPRHSLLLSQLPTDGLYGREGGTIFMWRDDVNYFALSFQDYEGWWSLLKAVKSLEPGYRFEKDINGYIRWWKSLS